MEAKMLELINPVGYPRIQAQANRRSLDTPVGKRLGFIYNRYPATLGFWAQLERALEDLCRPPHIERAYKSNTWAPLEPEKFRQIADAADYLVVGVGA
jgi:hypothetical protein